MSASSADRAPGQEARPAADRTVQVVLLKAGRTKIRYPARLLHDDGTRISVLAPWAGDGVRDFGFVRFEPGDVFVEHYWRDRYYAVKEVRAGDGALKGWYCDVTRPATTRPAVLSEDRPGATDQAGAATDQAGAAHRPGAAEPELRVEDLDLDLWVSGDGASVLRLDEDEFAASGLAGSDPEAASAALRALDELEHLARTSGFGPLLGVPDDGNTRLSGTQETSPTTA